MNKIWGFDLGKASTGVCIREKDKIEFLHSYLFDAEYADINKWKQARKASLGNRISKEKRENWLKKVWTEFNWSIPNTDKIAYLAGLKARLEIVENNIHSTDQLFYALYDLMQSRGYDSQVPWKNKPKNQKALDDEKENDAKINEYKKQIKDVGLSENAFLCHFESKKAGIYDIHKPQKLKGMVYPRSEIVKEANFILEKASQKFPELKKQIEYILWGTDEKPYNGLAENKQAYSSKYQGQGILGQKLPKFDNRIIGKCRLFERLNVCKANKEIIKKVNLLLGLKNILAQLSNKTKQNYLTIKNLRDFYEHCLENKSKKTKENSSIEEFKSITVNQQVIFLKKLGLNLQKEKNNKQSKNYFINGGLECVYLEEIKFKEGRASLSKLGAELIFEIILSGLSPIDYLEQNSGQREWEKKFKITNNLKTGITEQELLKAIQKLGKSWENITIGDNRDQAKKIDNKEQYINSLIGSVTSYVVKNRLQHFYNLIKFLDKRFGKPEKVVLEFVRDADSSFLPKKKKDDWDKQIKKNQQVNDAIIAKLKKENIPITSKNITACKLLEQQDEQCLYSGKTMTISDIKENYFEIDHIMPRSRSHCDALFNLALVLPSENQAKNNQTPHQYLSKNNRWAEFVERIKNNSKIQGKKRDLLLSQNQDGYTLIENWNGLCETAHISKLAQKIIAIHFGWELHFDSENRERKIIASKGQTTAQMRNWYDLNKLLHSIDKEEYEKLSESEQKTYQNKNRENDKHHALDAFCLTFEGIKNIQIEKQHKHERDRSFKEGYPQEKLIPIIKEELDKLIPLKLKNNSADFMPDDTIYGLKLSIQENKNNIQKYDVVKRIELKKHIFGEENTKKNKPIKESIDSELLKAQEEKQKDDFIEKQINKLKIDDIKKKIKEIHDINIQNNLLSIIEVNGLESFLRLLNENKILCTRFKTPIKKVYIKISKEKEIKVRADKNNQSRICIGEYSDYSKKANTNLKNIQLKRTKAHKGQLIYFDEKQMPRVRPLYCYESKKEVFKELKDKGYKVYTKDIFQTGCYIFIPEPFMGGANEYSNGVYKLRTIISDGKVKLESGEGQKIASSVKNLINAKFQKLKIKNYELSYTYN